MATIKDIAQISGYSIGTVSRVLNNRPDVSEQAREKILSVIKETDFRPNSNAQLLKSNTSSLITILVKGANNFFLEGILEVMQEILRQSGEQVAVMFLDENSNEVEAALRLCQEKKPKGLIFLGGNRLYFQQSFSRINIPSVLVSESAKNLPYKNLSSYYTDDMDASEVVMAHFIENGHEVIGIIGGSKDSKTNPIAYRRYKGAVNYLKDKQIAFDEKTQYMTCDFSLAQGYQATKELLNINKKITALYCISDTIAIGAMRAIHDMGLEVGKDVSVVGFDGLSFGNYMMPRLTTIKQDDKQLAVKAIEDILIRINYPNRENKHEVIPYTFYKGESVSQRNRKG